MEGQPSNNRSIEMQLMRRFQNDNLNLLLHQEASGWQEADFFLEALPCLSYDILSPADFDVSLTPGPKSLIRTLTPDRVLCLSKLYTKLYPSYSHIFNKGEVFVPFTGILQ